MPDPDDEEKKERKANCTKSESPVWKKLKPYRDSLKMDAKGERIYEWDNLHNEIEMYNKRGEHLGVVDPRTGLKIKDAVLGRSIKL